MANKEYFNLEMQFTKRTGEMESRIKEYQTRVQAYENIEKELDEVIMQAAEGIETLIGCFELGYLF